MGCQILDEQGGATIVIKLGIQPIGALRNKHLTLNDKGRGLVWSKKMRKNISDEQD